jgi:phenylacetate-CoA ligase
MTISPSSVYSRLPAVLQDFAVTAYGVRMQRLRRSVAYRQQGELLAKMVVWDADRLRAFQEQELTRVLQHAFTTVPFYRARWSAIWSESGAAFDRLHELPMIDKATVRGDPGAFLSDAVGEPDRLWVSTSGTTGTPQRLAVDRRSRAENHAYFDWLLRQPGRSEPGWGAVFMGRVLGSERQIERRPWRVDYLNRRVLFSSYHLSERTISAYVRKLGALEPDWIDAYPSALWSLAELANDHGLELPRPRVLLLSSETLGAQARDVIERAFRCRVTEFYAAAEQAAFISQCAHGSYHPHPAYGVVEFVPAGTDAGGERLFEMVATGFHNRALPLVRYRTGDLVTLSEGGPCPCGRPFAPVRSIVGRHYALIVTPDGRRIAGIGPALKGLPLGESQLVQFARDAVEFRVVPSRAGWNAGMEDRIIERLRERIGSRMNIKVTVVDSIPRGPNGKFHMTVNLVHGRSASGEVPAGGCVPAAGVADE